MAVEVAPSLNTRNLRLLRDYVLLDLLSLDLLSKIQLTFPSTRYKLLFTSRTCSWIAVVAHELIKL